MLDGNGTDPRIIHRGPDITAGAVLLQFEIDILIRPDRRVQDGGSFLQGEKCVGLQSSQCEDSGKTEGKTFHKSLLFLYACCRRGKAVFPQNPELRRENAGKTSRSRAEVFRTV